MIIGAGTMDRQLIDRDAVRRLVLGTVLTLPSNVVSDVHMGDPAIAET